jgi:biopolymer transport protein ExbB
MSRLKHLVWLCAFVPAVALGWWNPEWTARQEFKLDTTPAAGNLATTLRDVPVLLRLHAGNFPGFFSVAQGGADLRFVDGDDKTPLKHHVERFDPVSEIALVWVKLPQLLGNSNTQSLWMYYGNDAAANGNDPAGSFDVSQALVYHFAEESGAPPQDSTAYENHSAFYSGKPQPAGAIGYGARFDGTTLLRIADKPSLRVMPAEGWTFSLWLKADSTVGEQTLLHRAEGERRLGLSLREGGLVARIAAEGVEAVETAPVAVSPQQWHHVALVVEAGRMVLYLDGKPAAEAAVAGGELGGELFVGGRPDGANGFVGDVDELQIAKVARPPEWIAAAAAIQVGEKLVTAGESEQAGGGGGKLNLIPYVLAQVDLPGWMSLVVLAVLFALSWFVMISKGMMLGRVRKDNDAFITDFRALRTLDDRALDQGGRQSQEDSELEESPVLQALFGRHDHFQSSPLYRIYHTGMEQLRQRQAATVGAQAASLSPQALAAIRAALDATLVRESQKLNSLMVLLTIAISGGPFIGLFGTVVGVMVTFAAIAVTGGVTVDAIAPGVAAALVTTVAGLLVAIPALFGYNYLLGQVKAITVEMHVFVDELAAKIAEHHG